MLIAIDAKYIHTNNAIRLLKANTTYPVDLFEYTIKDDLENILRDIHTYQPDNLAFSCYIWNIELVKKLLYKLQDTTYTIILGGPEVSYESDDYLEKNLADFLIHNEGEHAFDQLLQALNQNKPLNHIPNLSYKRDEKIIHNSLQEIQDLGSLSSPHYFSEDIPHIPNKIAYIESSRGCPYRCSYCLSSLEKTVRFFPVEEVQKTILYLMNHGVKTVKFLDRTFNASKHTLAILDFIINHHNNETVFQFEITGDVLDPTIIDYLNTHASKGMFRFEIGIQSTNVETNKLVDRFQNNDKLFSNIRQIQKGKVIDLHLDLIAGLPKEDLPSFKNTFNEVFLLGAKELQLGFLKFLKGTKIRKEANMYKYEFADKAPYEIQRSDVLSEGDLEILTGVEHMLDLFHNKGYFGEHMHQYLCSLKSPFDFFKEAYIKAKDENLFSQGYQLEDVYKFAFSMIGLEEIIYKLKQDYLLRSKVKPKIFWTKRPDRKLVQFALETIEKQENHPLHKLYKHTVILENQNEIFVVYYQHLQARSYKLKK